MSDPNRKELTFHRILSAPRELVWKAWTNPTLLSQWWGPYGVDSPVCEFDPRVEGLIYIEMVAGEALGPLKGQRWPMRGVVKEFVEPEKLVYVSTAILNDKPVLETVTTVTLKSIGDKTDMTIHILVTKITAAGQGAVSGMEMGWNQQLEKLIAFLEHKQQS